MSNHSKARTCDERKPRKSIRICLPNAAKSENCSLPPLPLLRETHKINVIFEQLPNAHFTTVRYKTREKHMGNRTSYSKKEQQVIILGYLWRWGSIVIMLLIPAIVFGICNLVNTEPEIQGFVTFLSAGITMFCVGVYDIIGTVLEFKHVLVSLQLTCHFPFQNINPRRDWTKSEKREYIGVGIIFIILGLAFITIFALIQFGILK